MKKRILAVLTLFCIIFTAVPAFADSGRVFDRAEILTEAEETDLQRLAEQMQQDWDMDLAFLTTNDTAGKSVQEYGAEFYTEQGLGVGADADGVIFVLDMGSREGQIVTHGKAIDVFTDYYIEEMWKDMVDFLSEGSYYQAMVSLAENMEQYNGEYQSYLENPETYISSYQAEQKVRRILPLLGAAAALSLAIAAMAVHTMRKACKNVRPYTDGRAYLKENGYHLTVNRDSFASTHTALMPIPQNDNDNNSFGGGSWGGGSSTFNSGGSSFGGGGGKF